MKAIARVFAATGLVLFLSAATASAAGSIPTMSIEDLNGPLGDPDVVVVDVRTGGSWKGSGLKVKGAVKEDPSNVAAWMEKYPKDKTLVFYCS